MRYQRLQNRCVFARPVLGVLSIGAQGGSGRRNLMGQAGAPRQRQASQGVSPAQLERARIIGNQTNKGPMTTTLDEPRVLEIMRREHAIAQAREAELWDKMKIVEAEMQPYKDRYDEAIRLWSDANRLKMALAACLAAKAQEASAA